jgi:hypothetical protein
VLPPRCALSVGTLFPDPSEFPPSWRAEPGAAPVVGVCVQAAATRAAVAIRAGRMSFTMVTSVNVNEENGA